jgi:hypothetical protein
MALSFVAEAEDQGGAGAGTDSSSAQPALAHPTPSFWPGLTLFLVVVIGFACYRHDLCFVWDDSASMAGSLARSRWMRELHKSETPPSALTTVGRIFEEAFGHVAGNGYRPMAALFSDLSFWLLVDSDGPSWLHLLLAGAGYGCQCWLPWRYSAISGCANPAGIGRRVSRSSLFCFWGRGFASFSESCRC